jgi:hypothetical protein
MHLTELTVSETRQLQPYHPRDISLRATLDEGDDVDAIAATLAERVHTMLYADRQPPTAPYPEPAPELLQTVRPATDRQRVYIDRLMDDMGWDTERLRVFALEHHSNILTLTAQQASDLIEALKALRDGRPLEPPTRPVEQDDLPWG